MNPHFLSESESRWAGGGEVEMWNRRPQFLSLQKDYNVQMHMYCTCLSAQSVCADSAETVDFHLAGGVLLGWLQWSLSIVVHVMCTATGYWVTDFFFFAEN